MKHVSKDNNYNRRIFLSPTITLNQEFYFIIANHKNINQSQEKLGWSHAKHFFKMCSYKSTTVAVMAFIENRGINMSVSGYCWNEFMKERS